MSTQRLAHEAQQPPSPQAPRPRQAVPPRDPVCRGGLTKAEAEELLDWLAVRGYTGLEITVDDTGFVVTQKVAGPG